MSMKMGKRPIRPRFPPPAQARSGGLGFPEFRKFLIKRNPLGNPVFRVLDRPQNIGVVVVPGALFFQPRPPDFHRRGISWLINHQGHFGIARLEQFNKTRRIIQGRKRKEEEMSAPLSNDLRKRILAAKKEG
ncbi:MAG: hypothetical protein LBO00_01335, partial [Zoogloeaceae bacterium]|nr:hypothetical protein [Zoogloeaceae bacterium]